MFRTRAHGVKTFEHRTANRGRAAVQAGRPSMGRQAAGRYRDSAAHVARHAKESRIMSSSSSAAICEPVSTTVNLRSTRLADRLERGARALADFARGLSAEAWNMPTPGDGRTVGVIVHHVASVYPLEVRLAQQMAAGTPIVGVTWADVAAMNAGHAAEFAGVTQAQALALLAENSAAAAEDIRRFSDEELDEAVPVSLYGHAEVTCQFMLEDHAVRHSLHHLAKLRAAVSEPR
jgi:hypothetical protein